MKEDLLKEVDKVIEQNKNQNNITKAVSEKKSLTEAVRQSISLENERKRTMNRLVVAFDLDDTLIDSSHRIAFKEDGSFDLDYWIKNSTHEMVMKDSLLPLYHLFKSYKEMGCTVIAVTAREMSEPDYAYLEAYQLDFDYILERGNSKALDRELKSEKFKEFLSHDGRIPYLFFDDKDDNLEIAKEFGFSTIKSQFMNLKLVIKNQEAIKGWKEEQITVFKPKDEHLVESEIDSIPQGNKEHKTYDLTAQVDNKEPTADKPKTFNRKP